MRQRGRKSAAALSVIPGAPPPPPEPPPELSPIEATTFRALVARPNLRGAEVRGMVLAYCCHVANADRLAQVLREASTDDLKVFNRLAAAHSRESMAVARLASRLKLLPRKAEEPQGLKPWEITSRGRMPWNSPDDDDDEHEPGGAA